MAQVRLNIAGHGHGASDAELQTLAMTAPPVDVTAMTLANPRTIGRCLRYEYDAGEIWALAEITDAEASDELRGQRTHCEALVSRSPEGELQLHAVLVTSLPRGAISQSLMRKGKSPTNLHPYDPKCPDCVPVFLDMGTGEVLAQTHPAMVSIMKIWNTSPFKARQAYMNVTAFNSRDPVDLALMQPLLERMEAAFRVAMDRTVS